MQKLIIALLLFVLAGCSQSLYKQGRQLTDEGRYDRAIDVLYQELKINPQSGEAWRELGIAFYKNGDLDKAEDALQQANGIGPHARTNLYLGLIHENRNEYSKAINSYRAALELKPGSDVSKMLRDRLDKLITQNINREVLLAIQGEANINVDTIPKNTIAVVDFDNRYLDDNIKPIAKGLAEFTSLDLAKIASLRVVDRTKIDFIMQELNLSKSGYVDPAVAPRVGRLIGSTRLVTGSLVGLGDKTLRLDGAVVNVRDSSTKVTSPSEGSLEKFFDLQKRFVFQVIDNLGLSLTVEERDEIQKIPTESYLAFMAYCRGLDYSGKGMHQEAQREFGSALKIDAGFNDAGRKQEESSRALTVGAAGAPAFKSFESEVAQASDEEQSAPSVDRFQSSSLSMTGFMREGSGLSTIDAPLRIDTRDTEIVIRYGTVIIRGVLDANF